VRYGFLTEGIYGKQTIQPRIFGNVQEQRRFLKKIIIRMPFEPIAWFLFHFILKLGCLEGRRGLVASQIRSAYIAQTRAKIYEIRLNAGLMKSKQFKERKDIKTEILPSTI
jgi:hypothetical protein